GAERLLRHLRESTGLRDRAQMLVVEAAVRRLVPEHVAVERDGDGVVGQRTAGDECPVLERRAPPGEDLCRSPHLVERAVHTEDLRHAPNGIRSRYNADKLIEMAKPIATSHPV